MNYGGLFDVVIEKLLVEIKLKPAGYDVTEKFYKRSNIIFIYLLVNSAR